MNKEVVVLNLDGITLSQPYRQFYEQRNGQVARDIAEYLDIPYLGEVVFANGYVVPAKTLVFDRIESLGIKNVDDFYGGAVQSLDLVGKAILHPTTSKETPKFYRPGFTEQIQDLVLPGFTEFSISELVKKYKENICSNFRLKAANESDGRGQYRIENEDHLKSILSGVNGDHIKKHGIVLETELTNAKTISVGFIQIGQDKFSFIADQKNDLVFEEGTKRNRYLGCFVTVVKGELEKLMLLPILSDIQSEAIKKSIRFYQIYHQEINPLVSRLSFDYLYGASYDGCNIGGITDITARLGGTCPALMISALRFKQNPSIQYIQGEVTLNYSANELLESELNAKKYIDHPDLRIMARINGEGYA